MSYHLGIAHNLPALRRQLTSPTTSAFPSGAPAAEQHLAEDSKDVLIERLNDLVSRLSSAHSLDDRAVSTIHAQVDRIELLVQREERQQSPLPDGGEQEEGRGKLSLPRDEDTFWGPPSPSQSLRMRLPPRPAALARGQGKQREAPMSTAKAIKLAEAAEELANPEGGVRCKPIPILKRRRRRCCR